SGPRSPDVPGWHGTRCTWCAPMATSASPAGRRTSTPCGPTWAASASLPHERLPQRLVELRAPIGRIGPRFRPYQLALKQVTGRDPCQELAPASPESPVPPVIDGPGHRHGRPQARRDSARGGQGRGDGDADLEVEGVRGPAQMVREPRPGRGETLSRDGGQHL